ncbi:hypothetical protein [Lysobacter sp. Root983]|uniref:hypothetical protein n=1 Tax=Lysobacter sp. Root983 TaxID=1736613 RepID=UPI00070B711B|nr:hypothetical protein [Lysobacter sp. Root983]KRD77177.1 hypothetical protein ASE43_08430 [Lysobacter sp. Root983]
MEADRELTHALRVRQLRGRFRRGPFLVGTILILAMLVLFVPELLKGHWRTGWPALVFASIGLSFLPLLRASLRPAPHLTLNEHGLSTVFTGAIVWSDIVGLHLYTYYSRANFTLRPRYHLQLCLRRPERYRAPFWMRPPMRSTRSDFGLVWVPLSLFDVEARTLYTLAVTLRRADPAPFVEGWNPDMPLDEVAAHLRDRGATPAAPRAAAHVDVAVPAGRDAALYAQRLRESQDAGERRASSYERQRVQGLRRERSWRADDLARRRSLTWSLVVAYLLLIVAGYFLIDYVE